MRRAVCILLFFATLAGCRRWDAPEFPDMTQLPNMNISGLRDAYLADAVVSPGIVIAGRVVSSDRAGNFYNTFFIDDGTGAVEIMAGMPDLHATHRPGQRVVVSVRGLAVGWRDGVMQTGLPPEAGSRYATGYFYHREVMRTHVTAEHDVESVDPIETTIAGLDPGLCGRLVRISGLRADTGLADATWATAKPSPETGYVKFRSSPADSVTVATSGYASFAAMPVPRETVSLTGILFYGRAGASKDHYYLKLRDEKDVVH